MKCFNLALRFTLFFVFFLSTSNAYSQDSKLLSLILNENEFTLDFLQNKNEVQFGEHNFVFDLYQCRHSYRQGDSLLKLIRRYGYRSPYNLKLWKIYGGEFINPSVDGTEIKVSIPIIYLKGKEFERDLSCDQLVELNKSNPIIIRGKEATLKKEDGKIYYFAGFSRREFDYFEKNENFPAYPFVEIDTSESETKRDLILPIIKEVTSSIEAKEVELIKKKEAINLSVEKIVEVKEEVKNVVEEDKQGGKFLIFDGLYESIKDKENPIVIVSELQGGIRFKIDQYWSERVESNFQIGLMQHSFNKDNTDLTKTKTVTSLLSFGMNFYYSEQSSLYTRLTASEKVIYKQASEDEFSIEKDLSPSFAIGIDQYLFKYKNLSAYMLGEYEYYSRGNIYQEGDAVGSGFKFRYYPGLDKEVNVQLIYRQGSHTTSNVSFGLKELSFSMGIGLSF